jgi:hypothetical protein
MLHTSARKSPASYSYGTHTAFAGSRDIIVMAKRWNENLCPPARFKNGDTLGHGHFSAIDCDLTLLLSGVCHMSGVILPNDCGFFSHIFFTNGNRCEQIPIKKQ